MKKARIGLILPSSNYTMEPDFYKHIPIDRATIHFARLLGKGASRESEEQMLKGLPLALDQLKTADVDIILFGCTSAGTLHGEGTEKEIETLINKRTGIKGVTVTRALSAILNQLGAKRIILFTPYNKDLHDSVSNFMQGAGFEIVLSKGMGIVYGIADVEPEQIVEFVLDTLHEAGLLENVGEGSYTLRDGDAIVFSCTNFKSWDCLEIMEKKVKTKYTTSNHALFTYVMQLLNLS